MAKKILVPIFNRAHFGRLRSVLKAVKEHPDLELQVMVGLAGAYGGFFSTIKHSRPHSWRLSLPWYFRARFLSFLDFFKPGVVLQNDFLAKSLLKEGIKIDSQIPFFIDGGTSETMAKSVGLGIVKIVEELRRLKPDIVFAHADRFEMMAIAIAASYLNIPIAHNEAGDLSGTIDENVRHAITKLSHIHFTATEVSRKRVIQMGEMPEHVFNVGSPCIDIIKNLDLRFSNDILPGLKKPYLLVLLHPVATEGKEYNLRAIQNLVSLLKELRLQTVFLGSNIDAGSDEIGRNVRKWLAEEKPNFIFFTKHLEPDVFYKVLSNADCAIGNSSSFIREGAYLGTPAVIVGSRQRNRELPKSVEEVGIELEEIKKAVLSQLKHGLYPSDKMFGDSDTGLKIADILAKIKPEIQKRFNKLR